MAVPVGRSASERVTGARRRDTVRRALLVSLCCATLTACAGQARRGLSVEALVPLELEGGEVTVAEVAARAPTPDLLAVDDAMRAFVRRYTEGLPRGRARLLALHQAVRGQATLGIRYDPSAQGTASEVFHRGRANCLSYASLFVALAREAGLEADYQWLRLRPQWTLQGERVVVRLHVNVLVAGRRRDSFMVDIDPVETRDVAEAARLSDRDAQALYHGNIAVDALAREDVEQAWLHSVRALQISPDIPHLWVNLGAVYRSAGQHRPAEDSYLHALSLDPRQESAMNNLVVLYTLEGREEERAYWDARVAQYREANPYYHAWLGDRAASERDWRQARTSYERALELLPQNSGLLYALGLAHYRLHEDAQASGYIRRAIEHATVRADVDAYRHQLLIVESGERAGT